MLGLHEKTTQGVPKASLPEGKLACSPVSSGLNTKGHHSCVSSAWRGWERDPSLLSQSGMFHDLDLITQEMTHP